MQQEGRPSNSERYMTESGQPLPYQAMAQQVNTETMKGGMQPSQVNICPPISNMGSEVYLPNPQNHPFQSSHSGITCMSPSNISVVSPVPSQHYYSAGQQPWADLQSQGMHIFPQPSPNQLISPVSPRRILSNPNSPRKSLAGMMSPIRSHMPPPLSPGFPTNSPRSPLSHYMAQSPQRQQMHCNTRNQQRSYQHSFTTTGHVNSYMGLPHPSNPHTLQHSVMPEFAPPSPRFPVSQSFSNPPAGSLGMHRTHPHQRTQQSPISPQPNAAMQYRAARQIDLDPNPQLSGSGGDFRQPVPAMHIAPQHSGNLMVKDVWNETFKPPVVVPSLPVLSSETLDLLSTLTVSTVTSPLHSTVPVASESHIQRSPLLQQHLLMPTPPIKTQQVLTECTPDHSEPRRIPPDKQQGDIGDAERPPSRSNLMHNVNTSSKEERIARNIENINFSLTTVSNTSVETNIVRTVGSVSTDTDYKVAKGTDVNCIELAAVPGTPVVNVNLKDPVEMDVDFTTNTLKTSETTIQSQQMSVLSTTVCSTTAAVTVTTVTTSLASPVSSFNCKDQTALPPKVPEMRLRVCEKHRTKLQEDLELYKEKLTELFFLQNGGNYMDYIQFKKRPSTKLADFLNKMMPDAVGNKSKQRKESKDFLASNGEPMSPASDVSTSSRKPSSDDGKKTKLKSAGTDQETDGPEAPNPILLSAVDKSKGRSRSTSQEHSDASNIADTTKGSTPQPVNHNFLGTPKGHMSPLRLKRLQRLSGPPTLDDSIGSQEEILERAKQEAVVQRKVVELRKQGLWTQRRLPKVQEPPRNKAHWDYLLEEMRWLSADFAQERKWKRAAARKLVRTVAAYHKEQHDKVKRAEREEQNRLRRIASTMAREIRTFWGSIEKVVEYKQRSLLDEKRMKALDIHLSYIVDQTEKYSDWLTQGLNKQGTPGGSPTRSLNSSRVGSDDDFLPQGESTDDEETIAVAEEENDKSENTEEEISLLQQESELPFDELIKSLPQELIENIGKPVETTAESGAAQIDEGKGDLEKNTESPVLSPQKEFDNEDADSEEGKPTPISLRRSARKRKTDASVSSPSQVSKEDEEPPKKKKLEADGDQEFDAEKESDAGEDDEVTLEDQEKEEEVDHAKEIKDLQAEGEMPLEELMKMYSGAFSGNLESEGEGSSSSDESQQEDAEETKDLDSDAEESGEEKMEEEIGMDYLFKADVTKDDNAPVIVPSAEKEEKPEGGSPNKEITDVAAEAASLQPTGFTLATTQVVTPIPVLLKHTLREYQHIGLDWLVTMYDKRLNGILADEMGLGKTIQTIALLAHLACEKGVWGPHLIVVPTSVMLNWEMEFKKWCPGFKILTYYGSQKERKAKRTGWTKSNAFHVCITSYKLVLQDNVSFRRKKWKYLVLDEAQNIKNFKSQRWQTLLNFNSQRRLLLTGTPLQNNLMELWSLMHFLMPHVFQSHKEFKEWFSNPMTGMIEGSQDYNEKLVRRLHKVLRPFLLRRIKKDVEKQMPNKYEHVVRCHLSKRQRFLYEDFMSRAATKDTLSSGHFMSVINILMQLRKVCNHPNLFEPRSIVSPFTCDQLDLYTASLVTQALDKDWSQKLNLEDYHLHLPSLTNVHQYQAARMRELQTPRKLIEEMDTGSPQVGRSKFGKSQAVRDELNQLLRDREKRLAKNTATLNLSQTFRIPQSNMQMNSLPVITIPVSNSSGGAVQLTSSSSGNVLSSRIITIPTSKSDDSADSTGAGVTGNRSATPSQPFTLQYQNAQGTRVTIPNKQIRQLPGGVVQIVTSGIASKTTASPTPTVTQQSATAQLVMPGTRNDSEKTLIKDITEAASEDLDVTKPRKTTGTYTEMVHRRRAEEKRARLGRMADVNQRRCEVDSDWLPGDTLEFLKNIFKRPQQEVPASKGCLIESCVMKELIKSRDKVLKDSRPVTDRFVFAIPKVESVPVDFHVSHPSPSPWRHERLCLDRLQKELSLALAPFHAIQRSMRILFPEARLIQYDCGKLQVLDILLRRFWTEKHRCLIFTQMTRVLDILEAFLSYHGYRYLRLDGSTRVEERMILMERFNNDPKIFCFILSTRSGGVGVNLTGADTVIFYDSDWNPTMDAQAQDRCHRIGQTRDVNIYRLISERTVEENILKKANQKRLLGDMAIEGGSFTTAFFKEQAIKDLFNEPTGLEDLPAEKEEVKEAESPVSVLSRPITARQKAIAAAKEAESSSVDKAADEPKKSQDAKKIKEPKNWEDALEETEDREDVDAAKLAKQEQDADMEEFTENGEGDEQTEEGSRVHQEMKSLYEELTPVEQYALRYLEETTGEINREELELAEEQVHRSKKDWEISHLMALKVEEERRLEEEEDEIFYTREDAENQVNEGRKGGKKKKKKKERDICFLDMSSTSEEDEENVGVDVETFDNDGDFSDLRIENNLPKVRKPRKPREVKPKMKKSTRGKAPTRGRGASRGGRRGRPPTRRRASPQFISPSKRRRASELAYDITSHGYYQNDDYYYYNDEDEADSDGAEEPTWDNKSAFPQHFNHRFTSDVWHNENENEWGSSPSEEEYYSDETPEEDLDDYQKDDQTFFVYPGRGDSRKSVEQWTAESQRTSATNKPPLYNIVVETNSSPNITPQKPSKPRINLSTISQQVNRTINFTATPVRLPKPNPIPTISLRATAPIRVFRPATPLTTRHRLSSPNIRVVQRLPTPATKPEQAPVLNKIFQQQALQRQKLQSYKIPLLSGSRSSAQTTFRNVLPRGQTTAHGTTATIIPLSQLTSSINLTPVIKSTLSNSSSTAPGPRVYAISNNSNRAVLPKTTASTVMVPMSAFSTSQQTFVIQQSSPGQPLRISSLPTISANPTTPGSHPTSVVGHILKTSTGANIQKVPTSKEKRSSGLKQQPLVVPRPAPQNTLGSVKKKPEIDRGIFDIVNSMEFMSAPLQDPISAEMPPSQKPTKDAQGSLFDSLEQEFMREGGCDLTLASGDEDDLITLDLEPVSPSDPQLLDMSNSYENEEERNVFESFQSLLQQ